MNIPPKKLLLGSLLVGSVGAVCYDVAFHLFHSEDQIFKFQKQYLNEKDDEKKIKILTQLNQSLNNHDLSEIKVPFTSKKLITSLLETLEKEKIDPKTKTVIMEIMKKISCESKLLLPPLSSLIFFFVPKTQTRSLLKNQNTQKTKNKKNYSNLLYEILERFCKNFFRLNGFQIILKSLESHFSEIVVLITNVIKFEKKQATKVLFKNEKYFPILIENLRNKKNTKHYSMILESLTWSCEYSSDIVSFLYEENIIELLIELFQKYYDNRLSQNCSNELSLICSLFKDLCESHKEARKTFAENEEIIPNLLHLMKSEVKEKEPSTNYTLRSDILLFLSGLLESEECSKIIFQNENPLTFAFDQCLGSQEDLNLIYAALTFISTCTQLSLYKEEIIGTKEHTKQIVDLLEIGNLKILSLIVKTLKFLSISVTLNNPVPVEPMIELEIIKKIQPLLSIKPTEQESCDTVSNSIVVIGNCCLPSEKARKQVRELNVVQKMVDLLDSKDEKIRVNSAFSLANMIMDPLNQPIFIKNEGLEKTFNLFNSEANLAIFGVVILIRNLAAFGMEENGKISKQWTENVDKLIEIGFIQKLFSLMGSEKYSSLYNIIFECFMHLNNHPVINHIVRLINQQANTQTQQTGKPRNPLLFSQN
ncbi:armadillo repeat-containing protein 4 armc4 [Anaeramoeba flamelloides]|uniref:Armadillo repeat-containing protein 4 armc4 n=1 Tax=Anaeramoeba flamelloides TaxID=1746091 RepID=A0ABQ8YCF3_9EUKA|nr:armadillo repeat-containing protein 4 armc4 [Anaeramoeba flamelloides]